MAATKKKSTAKKSSSSSRGSSSSSSSSSRSTAKKAASKSSGGAAKKAGARKPNAAFMKAMTPSTELANVVGNKPMPRTEVTKKLWAYIKKNDLQDPKERRMINADDNLRPIFGGKKQVSMFDMTKMVNKHLRDS